MFPGNRHTASCFQPAVLAVETSLELTPEQRKRTVWRFDGGAGSDEQFLWLLARGYQVIGKGLSNRRAEALAQQVQRWDQYDDCWLGIVVPPIDYGVPVQAFVKKRLKKGKVLHSYYLTTLKLPAKGHFMSRYNDRGGAEVEQFRQDKSGLHLDTRQKSGFLAQTALILLTDLAHNLLTHFRHLALTDSSFHNYGQKRIVHDLLSIPGRLIFDGNSLARIELLTTHANSHALRFCLQKYFFDD